MDQLICNSLSHTHYWYEMGMLKVPAINRMMVIPFCQEIYLSSINSILYLDLLQGSQVVVEGTVVVIVASDGRHGR